LVLVASLANSADIDFGDLALVAARAQGARAVVLRARCLCLELAGAADSVALAHAVVVRASGLGLPLEVGAHGVSLAVAVGHLGFFDVFPLLIRARGEGRTGTVGRLGGRYRLVLVQEVAHGKRAADAVIVRTGQG
jgi:hypothetical protein